MSFPQRPLFHKFSLDLRTSNYDDKGQVKLDLVVIPPWFEENFSFWTSGLLEGYLSNRTCPLVSLSVGPSLNISETAHWFFLIFCLKLEHHKDTKGTESDF